MAKRDMPRKTISRSKPFEVGGMLVVELIRKPHDDKPDVFNLTWVRHPLEETEIQGKENNFIHADFGKRLKVSEEQVREMIKQQFCKYWQIITLWVPPNI